jgi:hypothetical protein
MTATLMDSGKGLGDGAGLLVVRSSMDPRMGEVPG